MHRWLRARAGRARAFLLRTHPTYAQPSERALISGIIWLAVASYVDLPEGQLGVDYLLVVLLLLHGGQQGAKGPEVEGDHGRGVSGQILQLPQQPRLLPHLQRIYIDYRIVII